MKKQVTIKFNIGLTFVFFLYAALHYPFMEETVVPMDKIFESTPGLAFGILFLIIPISLIIFMHAVKAVWNRLFPKLCGWEEIGLAEAYALSLLVAFFTT
jgi:hypothetical protein